MKTSDEEVEILNKINEKLDRLLDWLYTRQEAPLVLTDGQPQTLTEEQIERARRETWKRCGRRRKRL